MSGHTTILVNKNIEAGDNIIVPCTFSAGMVRRRWG